MTKNEIIRMAREAGFTDADDAGVWITDGYWTKELERFANLVAQKEREECAKVIESIPLWKWLNMPQKDCAAEIREKG